ncbi:MAG: hypothetical protein KDI92_05850 [Xanthomonadales bacterium]|nr:hypothetical protein [Xanthomonadales bacterium]
MRSKHWIVLTLIFMMVLLYLWQQQPPQFKNQKVNTVIFQSKDETQQAVTKDAQKVDTKATEPVIEITETPNPKGNNNDQERTYLQVYRDLQLAGECNKFYFNNHQYKGNYDYTAELTQAYRSLNKTDDLPPATQLDALEQFVQSCLDLKRAVFARADIPELFPDYQFAYPVTFELRKELNKTKPETPEGKHLAGAIKHSGQWVQLFNQMIDAATGKKKHSSSIIKMMREEAQVIRDEISILYQANPVDGEQIALLQQQINDLYLKMEERQPASKEAVQQAKEAFLPTNALMEKNLRAPYPDSFTEIIKNLQLKSQYDLRIGAISSPDYWAIYLKKYIPWHLPPSHHIMQQSPTTDTDHFNLLIESASMLYLCYLGADCGPNSVLVRKYCLNPQANFQNNYPNACGKTLIDFYTENYLTPNQWKDVSSLFDIMVNMYGS